jgi:hypothetical protein
MNHFTMETYNAKREILTFANHLSKGCFKLNTKFAADMLYGMIASGSVILSDMADALKEDTGKRHTVKRLSRRLPLKLPDCLYANYVREIRGEIPEEPIVLLDDSDVIKPYGKKFEHLGIVRDGSALGSKVKTEKGYLVTEAVVLSKEHHPISLFSHIFSEKEEEFQSVNTHTFQAIDAAVSALGGKRATFVMDRGYDANKIFSYMYKKDQQFIIRITQKRKLFLKGKWLSAPVLCASRKGKFKTTVKFQSEEKACYLSVVNVNITESKKPLRLVLVYGLSDTPMMLVTNRKIMGKDDAVKIVRTYLSRWRIEEYFRFKKQHFGFEHFRVRSINAIRNLNAFLTYAISFMNKVAGKAQTHRLKVSVYRRAGAINKKVLFHYYRIAKGLAAILSCAKSGIKAWYKPKRETNPQLCFFQLLC